MKLSVDIHEDIRVGVASERRVSVEAEGAAGDGAQLAALIAAAVEAAQRPFLADPSGAEELRGLDRTIDKVSQRVDDLEGNAEPSVLYHLKGCEAVEAKIRAAAAAIKPADYCAGLEFSKAAEPQRAVINAAIEAGRRRRAADMARIAEHYLDATAGDLLNDDVFRRRAVARDLIRESEALHGVPS